LRKSRRYKDEIFDNLNKLSTGKKVLVIIIAISIVIFVVLPFLFFYFLQYIHFLFSVFISLSALLMLYLEPLSYQMLPTYLG
jgi:flagellar biosynthesis component FlhA